MDTTHTIPVADDDAEVRLDRWVKRRFPSLPHGHLEKLLRTGQIRVDGRRAKAGQRLEAGQLVRLPPGIGEEEGKPARALAPVSEADARWLRSLVLHRDRDVIAINKPPGLAVQGGTKTGRHLDGMLDALTFDGSERPRLVHRLDRDTSGVLLLARHVRAAAKLAEAFRHKSARKLYWALVAGRPKPANGKIDLALIKGKGPGGERMTRDDEEGERAITRYATIEAAGNRASWLVLWPLTGRTHQLRVHCAEGLGCPVVGDGKYGGAAALLGGEAIAPKLHLHARSIELPHPAGGRLRVVAPLPEHMLVTWRFFGFDPASEVDPFPEER